MSDVIPVRDDESFDVEALRRWSESVAAIPAGTPTVAQFANGRANLTYLLTYPGGAELVLRRPPLGPVAEGSHDMSREFRVLSRLWRSFPLAPRALAMCEDPAIIGAQFFVMDRRPGVVVKNVVPERFGSGADPVANRSLSTVVIDTLAMLHAVDPAECGLDDLGRPEGFLHRQVEGWAKRWDGARSDPNPLAEELSAWLAGSIPDTESTALIHNDWRLDNMAVAPEDPGTCVAVYDWDMATRGDPLADVGTLMATWYEPGEAPAALNPMPTSTPGWMSRAEALQRYSSRSGRDLDAISWYIVFGTWKLAIVLQQIYIRWLRGQTTDPRFEALGSGAMRLFELAADRRP